MDKPKPAPVGKTAAEHASSSKSTKLDQGAAASEVNAQGAAQKQQTPSPTSEMRPR
jgi:hypothetical protein